MIVSSAQPGKVMLEIEVFLIGNSILSDISVLVSGKTGLELDNLLESIVKYIPSPSMKKLKLFKALIFDSHYDELGYTYNRIIDVIIKKGDKIKIMSTNKEFWSSWKRNFSPKMKEVMFWNVGSVGYIITGDKSIMIQK